jgi:hypothetical protein
MAVQYGRSTRDRQDSAAIIAFAEKDILITRRHIKLEIMIEIHTSVIGSGIYGSQTAHRNAVQAAIEDIQ